MGWIILAIVIVVIIALVLWAVGAYNAGFRRTDRQDMRRLAYARKIEAIYRAIKANKNAGQSRAVKNERPHE